VATVVSLVATLSVRPGVLANFRATPLGFVLLVGVVGSMVVMGRAIRRGQERAAFAASCAYLIAMLGGAAFALYPVLLPSSGDAALALTIDKAATSPYGMRVAMTWWIVAAILVTLSFRYLYRSFRGKLVPGADAGYGEH